MNGSYPNESEAGQTVVIGSSGFIGRFITEACLDSGRPTYILVRSSSNSPSKASTIKFLQDKGAIRFVPSEFGHDIDRAEPVEPGLTMYEQKRKIRRQIEECGIPYSYICCNSIAAWPYHDNTHPADVLPPLDRFQIYGDGTVKGTPAPHLSFL
ncbi:Leucoanthocyanidin reductase [Gossypium arboreum]|uniref:Leucoanthocyanidin reductase n=1 Tax=Gossypium arboreum TaxID=29729 RepID=A0A0B0NKS7_GOSAR|nr:Leucoanthocyanidin reductase [Gossypium arboreum]